MYIYIYIYICIYNIHIYMCIHPKRDGRYTHIYTYTYRLQPMTKEE